MSAALPGGAPLAQGEAPLVGDQFMLSALAFYLHTDLVLTNRRLYAVRPNVVAGLIPVGRAQSNVPIRSIVWISSTAGLRPDAIAFVVVNRQPPHAGSHWPGR